MFRYKASIDVSYERQGYIYFVSLLYPVLTIKDKKQIVDLCIAAAGEEYYKALLEFVTTEATATAVCMRHYISKSTLYRLVKAYYESFPDKL